ncbi:MAG TPA: HAD family hydrolase [Bacteroidales bacterium]|nr:MAG: hypothetical protein A2X11_09715 [Bacteroidetes bacterium GWE2_42_24]OFY26226.1 MAG: hypothetical protein A2X09_05430 [Bacteroidetes bacterium GWF2_43_11]HBZ67497.1 HAD family hydrolase [Bacteroidales bacterium]
MVYKTIIWDWNGTLLNDVSVCIGSMNKMLSQRGLPLLNEHRYRQIFTFPVKDYYDQLGFDDNKDPFEEIGLEFIRYFRESLPGVPLQEGAKNILAKIKADGHRQVILSAMEHQSLIKNVRHFQIDHWFDSIIGIDNDYGGGKSHLVQKIKDIHSIAPDECLMIGDTLHDAEVALQAGWNCALTASGHQSYNRLLVAGVPVFHDLNEIGIWLSSLQD